MINHIKFYEVWDNYSEDGRSPFGDKVIGRFSEKLIAEQYSVGRGNYGHNANVRLVEFDICDTIKELIISDMRDKKKQALNKLTDEEKILLGLA